MDEIGEVNEKIEVWYFVVDNVDCKEVICEVVEEVVENGLVWINEGGFREEGDKVDGEVVGMYEEACKVVGIEVNIGQFMEDKNLKARGNVQHCCYILY